MKIKKTELGREILSDPRAKYELYEFAMSRYKEMEIEIDGTTYIITKSGCEGTKIIE